MFLTFSKHAETLDEDETASGYKLNTRKSFLLYILSYRAQKMLDVVNDASGGRHHFLWEKLPQFKLDALIPQYLLLWDFYESSDISTEQAPFSTCFCP